MAKYVDGFVFVVPNDQEEEYKKMAEEGARMWKSYGALEYFECKADDIIPKPMGDFSQLGFPALTKVKPDETVWFSFIVYRSKKQRDEINAKVNLEMEKEMAKHPDTPIPFEMDRFSSGGFEVVVEG